MAPRNVLVEHCLDLAWSHWVGLGVRGTAPPPSSAVDPEALLYFTAALVEDDPRLRDEVTDWWSRFQRHVSRSRVNALAARFDAATVEKARALEATVTSKKPTSGKSVLVRLDSVARSLLRLRSAFGATARAEILLELLTRDSQIGHGLTALAFSELGYTKRNVALVLEELGLAGLVTATREGNRVLYRLLDAAALAHVLRPLPTTPCRWHLRFSVLVSFLRLARQAKDRDVVAQGIEARKLLTKMMPLVVASGVSKPAPTASAETYWMTVQRWLVDNLISEPGVIAHRIPNMIEGAWVGPNQEPERPAHFSNAILPRTTSHGIDAGVLEALDLVQVATNSPTESEWGVLSIAATQTYQHTIGLDRGEHWRFITWVTGEPRSYAAEYAEPLPHDRIAKRYGMLAADRARADRPAVQLRLRRVD